MKGNPGDTYWTGQCKSISLGFKRKTTAITPPGNVLPNLK